MPEQPVAILNGEIGLLKGEISEKQVEFLKTRLTLRTTPYKGVDPENVLCYRDDGDRIWMPRHFAQGFLWQLIDNWRWTDGIEWQWDKFGTPDPERGQPESIQKMIEHLEAKYAGILISPTGTGKTFMACWIGAHLQRYIGWFAYSGHMVDNAMEHAQSILGLREDQIGLVQGDRCDIGKPFTIMMVQSLLKRTYPDELYEQIGLLVADEVHRYGAQEWRKVIAKFPARYRLGVSADPNRSDGLGDLITWTFGHIGHESKRIRNKDVKPPSVVGVKWNVEYPLESYCSWKKDRDGEWVPGDPHPTKYDKKLSKDNARSKMFSVEIANAAEKGRNILVFSRMVEHLKATKTFTDIELEERGKLPSTSLLIGEKKGSAKKKKAKRAAAMQAQVIFTTYAMAREALNIPKLDTMFFLTPPGNALQPIGRLREKSEGHDRKSLLIVDGYESCGYSRRKFRRRQSQYASLGIPVKVVQRSPQ
jgi:superfamily II DNA or RNA helicase